MAVCAARYYQKRSGVAANMLVMDELKQEEDRRNTLQMEENPMATANRVTSTVQNPTFKFRQGMAVSGGRARNKQPHSTAEETSVNFAHNNNCDSSSNRVGVGLGQEPDYAEIEDVETRSGATPPVLKTASNGQPKRNRGVQQTSNTALQPSHDEFPGAASAYNYEHPEPSVLNVGGQQDAAYYEIAPGAAIDAAAANVGGNLADATSSIVYATYSPASRTGAGAGADAGNGAGARWSGYANATYAIPVELGSNESETDGVGGSSDGCHYETLAAHASNDGGLARTAEGDYSSYSAVGAGAGAGAGGLA